MVFKRIYVTLELILVSCFILQMAPPAWVRHIPSSFCG
jgi:hypothetical protein